MLGAGFIGNSIGQANRPATGQPVIAQSPAAQPAQFAGAPMAITPESTSQYGTPRNDEKYYTPGHGMPLWMNIGQPQQVANTQPQQVANTQPQQAANTQPPGFLVPNQVS